MIKIDLKGRSRFADMDLTKHLENAKKYPMVEWGCMIFSPCAVVGGGPGLDSQLNVLRNWKGDIFGVNDTAGYLSDHGIASYVFSIDAIDVPFKIGKLVKGGMFATRVHKKQFTQLRKKPIRVFQMCEDHEGIGIEGGPTGVCRAAHLFLRMGYGGVVYFGIEGCFYNTTHMGGNRDDAFWNMIIVEIGGKQYLTNAGLLLQTQWMADCFKKYPRLLKNASGGFMEAMVKDPEGWHVLAVTGDMKNQCESGGKKVFSQPYTVEEDKLWRPPLAIASVSYSKEVNNAAI